MAAKIRNITGGTEPLCRTCRYAIIVQGPATSQKFVRCQYVNRLIHFEAIECSGYSDRRQPSLNDMQNSAWILRTEKFGRKIGFVSPEERRKDGLTRFPVED